MAAPPPPPPPPPPPLPPSLLPLPPPLPPGLGLAPPPPALPPPMNSNSSNIMSSGLSGRPAGVSLSSSSSLPPSLPPSNVVLLMDVPEFLHSTLGHWISPCGPARTILWYPKQQLQQQQQQQLDGDDGMTASNRSASNNATTTTTTTTTNETERDGSGDKVKPKSVALVTMMHGDGAWKLVHSIHRAANISSRTSVTDHDKTNNDKQQKQRQESVFGTLRAQLVPASPDIPLPPIDLDDMIAKPLLEVLISKFNELKQSNGILSTNGISTANENETDTGNNQTNNSFTTDSTSTAAATTTNTTTTTTTTSSGTSTLTTMHTMLDSHKVAAAAGGTYDEDVDPLNAPAVLEAVKKFRKGLQKTLAIQQARRIELVSERLSQTMERIRNNHNNHYGGGGGGGLASEVSLPTGVPPLTGLGLGGILPPPPPTHGLPPPPLSTFTKDLDTGKRGLSNLPAWKTTTTATTTSQQQDNNHDQASLSSPNTKKRRKELDVDALRVFVAAQIKQFIGEEEMTLINFIVDHVSSNQDHQQKPISDLVEELKPVLDEDTNTFLTALQKKVKELTEE